MSPVYTLGALCRNPPIKTQLIVLIRWIMAQRARGIRGHPYTSTYRPAENVEYLQLLLVDEELSSA